jgi:hypothetical protein
MNEHLTEDEFHEGGYEVDMGPECVLRTTITCDTCGREETSERLTWCELYTTDEGKQPAEGELLTQAFTARCGPCVRAIGMDVDEDPLFEAATGWTTLQVREASKTCSGDDGCAYCERMAAEHPDFIDLGIPSSNVREGTDWTPGGQA